MKIDALGQFVLILAIILLYLPSSFTNSWSLGAIVILGLWQLASAVHLWWSYAYAQKLNFIKAMAVVLVSLPLWMRWVGSWAYLPVAILFLSYFYQTYRDWTITKKQHISFWDFEF